MNAISGQIQRFIEDLRGAGISVSPVAAEDCYRSLALTDWSTETVFYTALLCTLLKESAFIPVFQAIYNKNFHFHKLVPSPPEKELKHADAIAMDVIGSGQASGRQKEMQQSSGQPSCPHPADADHRHKDWFALDFYTATYSASAEDIRKMEQLIPLLGKRMAAKIIMKKRHHRIGRLDFRRTIRSSMSTGGVPIDIRVKKKAPEKPVIFALCDVSRSCLHFSYFSLSLVYLLEKFYRQVRSFAFIDETDEITSLIKKESYAHLRSKVLTEANVCGNSGYTNYGRSLASFRERYGKELSSRAYVLIFGDARTNWFATNPDILKDIQRRVKRIYWFDPEPKDDWGSGDSEILVYQKYCTRVFECCNLNQLAQAISDIV
ncbi:VWA domain-containing protein [Syntrophomonas curvata]